jgi:hypothetical protein
MFLGLSQASYDMELKELQDTFHEIVVHILSRERSSSVKRTLLMVSAPPARVKLIAGGIACCVLRYTNTHTHTHTHTHTQHTHTPGHHEVVHLFRPI